MTTVLRIVIFSLSINLCIAESESTARRKVIAKNSIIESAAKAFSINQNYLRAIIYTERRINFDWTDEVFDELLAINGKNSSIGFSQIKLKTAYFIERILNDANSKFYPGGNYNNILEISKSPANLIEKLQIDSLNIYYAAGYVRIIQSFWKSQGFHIEDKPEIVGTLFQTGLFYKDGSLRKPNINPQANNFGNHVSKSINFIQTNQMNSDKYDKLILYLWFQFYFKYFIG